LTLPVNCLNGFFNALDSDYCTFRARLNQRKHPAQAGPRSRAWTWAPAISGEARPTLANGTPEPPKAAFPSSAGRTYRPVGLFYNIIYFIIFISHFILYFNN
jgi:hypothetical protein